MNVYGNALMTAKREANSKVVKMALRSGIVQCKKRQPHSTIPKAISRPLLFGVIWG